MTLRLKDFRVDFSRLVIICLQAFAVLLHTLNSAGVFSTVFYHLEVKKNSGKS